MIRQGARLSICDIFRIIETRPTVKEDLHLRGGGSVKQTVQHCEEQAGLVINTS